MSVGVGPSFVCPNVPVGVRRPVTVSVVHGIGLASVADRSAHIVPSGHADHKAMRRAIPDPVPTGFRSTTHQPPWSHGRSCGARTIPRMTDIAADTRIIDAEAPQYNATLVRREDLNESLAYFWVRFDGEPTPFEAGQYMTIG